MGKYLKYILNNIDPVRIKDDSSSQPGQTSAMRYIPGSSIRGIVVGKLANDDDFPLIKKKLFTEPTVFLNAYLTTKEHTLMPSPMGFYEDKSEAKGEKEIQNVVINGDFSDGMKRASLGAFCYIDSSVEKTGQKCIHYYNTDVSSDLKIQLGRTEGNDQNVFRLEHMTAGKYFEGYIHLSDDEALNERICNIFTAGKELRVGNARSSGLGRCKIISSQIVDEPCYGKSGFDAENECYMMLLSDLVMRDQYGEFCGLDIDALSNLFGVEELEICYASTSTRMIHGYNRTLGAHLPTVPVYMAGSVFHFTYKGTLQAETMRAICDAGLGERKNEGLGRVLFLKDYNDVTRKKKEEYTYCDQPETVSESESFSEDDRETLKIAAKRYLQNSIDSKMEQYIVSHPLEKGGIKNSQIGQVEARLQKFRYNPAEAQSELKAFFEHAREKEEKKKKHQNKVSIQTLENSVMSILDSKVTITDILGLKEDRKTNIMEVVPMSGALSAEEDLKYRIQLLIKMFRYDHRKG